MTSTLKIALVGLALLVPAASSTSAASAQSDDQTFTISNESSYRIDHVYMTRSSDRRWGGDLLDGYLRPNQYLELNVDPGRYDIKVVDRDGDACVIAGVDVFQDEVWHLTNTRLLACEFVS